MTNAAFARGKAQHLGVPHVFLSTGRRPSVTRSALPLTR